jgi:hypothetical protein
MPLVPAIAPTALMAQLPPGTCSGNLNIVRVSEIKPGMLAKFLQAVEAQKAWYKAAGSPDEITVLRVMDRDQTTKTAKISETEVLTTHVESVDRKMPPHDAGYDAFVAMFKESSTIKSEYVTCIVK